MLLTNTDVGIVVVGGRLRSPRTHKKYKIAFITAVSLANSPDVAKWRSNLFFHSLSVI